MAFKNVIDTISQQTGGAFNLMDGPSRTRFLDAVASDVGVVSNQLNNVYYKLFKDLPVLPNLDPLDVGLGGSVIYADPASNAASASVFYDVVLGRPKTIKESLDTVVTTIAGISGQATASLTGTTDLQLQVEQVEADLNAVTLDLRQLANDTMGENYALSGSVGLLDYPLSQYVDSIGALFAGYVPTGNAYDEVYPTLRFTVNLTDVVINTTLPQSAINNLQTYLANIRSYVGMTGVATTPSYSTFGAVSTVVDGEGLTRSIYRLDAAIDAIALVPGPFATAANVTSNSNGVYASDSFVFGSDSLNDTGVASKDGRFLFDKTTSSFRAGRVTGTQWDTRGNQSVAFGLNNIATGTNAFVVGSTNEVDSTSDTSSVLSGQNNVISNSDGAVVLSGVNNVITDIDGAVAMGNNAQPVRINEFAMGAGTFPSDLTDYVGQAQASTFLLKGEWAPGAAEVIATFDGATLGGSNAPTLPDNCVCYVVVDWVLYGTQSSAPLSAGGTFNGLLYRTTGNVSAPSGVTDSIFEFRAGTTPDYTMHSSLGPLTQTPVGLFLATDKWAPIMSFASSGLTGGGSANGSGRFLCTVRCTQLRF